jgi:hypothetical protein
MNVVDGKCLSVASCEGKGSRFQLYRYVSYPIDYDYVAADRRSDEKKMQMVGGDGALLEAVVSETFRNHLN